MEQLKSMKEMLVGCVQGQLTHLDTVDAQELGAAVDMIKDLSEAIYYCTITEAMEKKEEYPFLIVNKTIKKGDIINFENPIIIDETLLLDDTIPLKLLSFVI